MRKGRSPVSVAALVRVQVLVDLGYTVTASVGFWFQRISVPNDRVRASTQPGMGRVA